MITHLEWHVLIDQLSFETTGLNDMSFDTTCLKTTCPEGPLVLRPHVLIRDCMSWETMCPERQNVLRPLVSSLLQARSPLSMYQKDIDTDHMNFKTHFVHVIRKQQWEMTVAYHCNIWMKNRDNKWNEIIKWYVLLAGWWLYPSIWCVLSSYHCTIQFIAKSIY